MRILTLITLFIVCNTSLRAARISGKITDENGQVLVYASILVKGTTQGTTANKEGDYFLHLQPGTYTLVAQYVGYNRQEKTITVTTDNITLDFQLSLHQLNLKEVIVRPGAEDPAYEIIRNAIKKRPYYLNQLNNFQCEVYIKGQLQLRAYPKKFLGEKVDFEDGDTSQRKMLFLSETIARYSVEKPRRNKIEVLSTKVSGKSDEFGLSTPQIISFYENNIQVGRNLNPRGFISPIASGALYYYRYQYEGSFTEDGREISRIRVIPKRRYEPLFSGYINITEGDWRIHSLQLRLTKASQMELIDSLNIEQLYVPYNNDVWVIKTQVLYPAVKVLGFDAFGSFVNVYSQFNIEPSFTPKFFNNTYLKIYEGSNKKPADFWDSIRPVPLQAEEIADYHRKDSLEKAHKDPHYLDSIDRRRNQPHLFAVLATGQNFYREKKREIYTINPLLQTVAYNTVEGWLVSFGGRYLKRLDTIPASRRAISIEPAVRYGFSNHHLNAAGTFTYRHGRKYFSSISISGGKWVYQVNNANPISQFSNTIRSWLFERNYAKFYEAWYARFHFSKDVGNGISLFGGLKYEDRIPLENTTTYSLGDRKSIEFTPNYPIEIMSENFKRHQAFIGNFGVSWLPGTKYIEYPERIMNIGSKYPTFTLSFTQGVHNLLGSDVDYAKWRFDVSESLNLKLGGNFRYNMSIGGFLRRDSVAVIDYTHFNGNQILASVEYLHGFQLLPYYKYSNKNRLYAEGHFEHHFNGLLTNKIPLFRNINWYLVMGANAIYADSDKEYVEVFAGFENLLKIARVDLVWGFDKGRVSTFGVRLGIRGFGKL
ncbi:carboxypeptidase-like regulatory domain-containing protein [Niastella caeni]|uniref:Carboxypeptidase-like regulatory domain-containing protein n=1 Tax=Niastella caeni TaxID=2569763 RepID=A0A4S8HE86_9BACT|nr:DUF5686 and carboxypeptidase regulatory-like domain-containing protein [Niastella caeni]THU32439.1 carboxypeptidase-like regulatory domain-containing protein [Niastella caeni]